MDDAIETVRAFNRDHDLSLSPDDRLLDLVAETGELSKEVLKSSDYGEGSLEATPAIEDELGDVWYCLLALADELGVDPGAALASSLEKYRQRAGDSGGVGSGE